MTVCRYFKQGNCKNGARCNFEHPRDYRQNNSNHGSAFGGLATKGSPGQSTIDVTEITEETIRTSLTREAPQWPLTCFCPLRNGSSNLLSGFDMSFEEVRLGAYEAVQTNSFPSYEAQINNQLQTKASRVQVVLNNLKEAVKFAKETNANTNSGSIKPLTSSTPSNLGGSTFNSTNTAFQAPSNLSGSPISSNPFSMNSVSAFATSSTPVSSNNNLSSPFTSVAANPTSAFGVQVQPPSAGSTTLNTSSGPFGNLNSNTAPNGLPRQSAFGSSSVIQSSVSPSAFGQPAIVGQTTPSVFNQPMSTQSVFGQSTVPQTGFGLTNAPQPAFPLTSISGPSNFGQSGFNQNVPGTSNTQSAFGAMVNHDQSSSVRHVDTLMTPITLQIDNANPDAISNSDLSRNGLQTQSNFSANKLALSSSLHSTNRNMNGTSLVDGAKSSSGSTQNRHRKRPPVSEAFQKQIRDNPTPLTTEDLEQYKNATFGEKIPENPPSLELIYD